MPQKYIIMELWVQIATVIALLSFAALCLYGVVTLKDVRRSIALVQGIVQSLEQLPMEMKEVRMRLLGTLKNLEETSKNTALITQKIHNDLDSADGIFAEIEALTRQIRRAREYMQTGIIQPLGNIAITISALSKGSEAFVETLRKPRKDR
jgi:hypothetical protein